MKILVLSSSSWTNDNSFGNSFENIFEGIPDVEIANIYCKYGNPKTNLVSRFFQITEKSLLKNLKNPKISAGKEVFMDETAYTDVVEPKSANLARKKRWIIMFWARDLIWKFSRWKSPELKKFIDDFNFADELMKTESTALQFISLFKESEDFELSWVRNSGTKCDIPEGYDFIGYDISYPCDYAGSFSIICDCMFICRWHGCDKEGKLFLPDFNKLNESGLFDDWQSAYDYMVKYISEDWTERGNYCIFEIFKKSER